MDVSSYHGAVVQNKRLRNSLDLLTFDDSCNELRISRAVATGLVADVAQALQL